MENQNLKNIIKKILKPVVYYDLRDCNKEDLEVVLQLIKGSAVDYYKYIKTHSLFMRKDGVWYWNPEDEEGFKVCINLKEEINHLKKYHNNLENLSDDTLLSLEEIGATKEELNQDKDLEVVRKVLESRGEAYSIPSVLEVIAEYKGMEYEELLTLLELTHERS